jgi:hypothetical protein
LRLAEDRGVTTRRIVPLLLFVLGGALVAPASAGDNDAPLPRVVDSAKIKARELDKQRLIAKLHAEVPKVQEAPAEGDALSAPLFRRYDRPWVTSGRGPVVAKARNASTNVQD